MKYRWFTLAIPIAALTFLEPCRLNAQNIQSTILGVVTDSAGTFVPNAEITVRNEGNQLRKDSQD